MYKKHGAIATKKNHTITITDDIKAVAQDMLKFVATDTWISLWYDNERAQRLSDFKNYTITEDVMGKQNLMRSSCSA